MKKLAVTFFLFFAFFLGMNGQNYYTITFDGTGTYEIDYRHHLFIDTISNPSNIWQTGHVQKTVFTNAVDSSRVMVTDSLNPYPVNNTSSFVIWHLADIGFTMPYNVSLRASYLVNSDTLTDYGTVEFSPDNGNTWIDLVNTTTYANNILVQVNNTNMQPVFSGNSNGWQYLYAEIHELGPIFNIQANDTVRWRFSFTSDGIQTNKDGLLFDNIEIWDVPPIGFEKTDPGAGLQSFPNPAQNSITVEYNPGEALGCIVKIYNSFGQAILEKAINGTEKNLHLDVKDLPEGLYTYTISNNKKNIIRSGKFLKSN